MRTRTILVIGLLTALVGCGGNGSTDVSGRVTIGGKPVGAGTVVFTSIDGIRQGSAMMLDDGTFRMRDAPVGDVTVHFHTKHLKTLRKPDPTGKPNPEATVAKGLDPDLMGSTYTPIPDRYESPETSGLKIQIVPGTQSLQIEIPPG
jgi:hypothetical protein